MNDISKETEEFMVVFRRAARWVQFGIVCGIVGCITGVAALIVSLR